MISAKVTVKIVKDERSKYDEIMRRFKRMQGKTLKIGFLEGKTRRDGTLMAMIASVHEFGSIVRGIPQRSFMRSWIDSNQSKIFAFVFKEVRQIIGLQQTEQRGYQRIGAWSVGELKKSILKLTSPPLSPRTIAKKKSSKLLIDTGQMINSIRYKIFGRKI